MAEYVVRLWLPDRPGALGAVASRIGAVRGDVRGIDVLERNAGMAVDELVVDLPDPSLVDLMTREIHQVEGARVEEVHASRHSGDRVARELDGLVAIVGLNRRADVLALLAEVVCSVAESEWSAVLDRSGPAVLNQVGEAPPARWLAVLAEGLATIDGSQAGDVAVTRLDMADLCVAVGRPGRPFRQRELVALDLLCRGTDHHLTSVALGSSVAAHPSASGAGPRPVEAALA